MKKKSTIHPTFKKQQAFLNDIVENYDVKGENFGNQDRNSLKLFRLNKEIINVKSFKIPNSINQIVYRFFRKSKAQRSFEYATILQERGIGTPQPIAYFTFTTACCFKISYYISEQIDATLTYRELVTDPNFPNHEEILRAFTRFTFHLHEKGICFLDHSPGNTLIVKEEEEYSFYLVDLNRMKFQQMNFHDRMQNFSRLTPKKEMIAIMSDEYAKLSALDFDTVFKEMWKETNAFQEKFQRKQRLKKRLKFWKK